MTLVELKHLLQSIEKINFLSYYPFMVFIRCKTRRNPRSLKWKRFKMVDYQYKQWVSPWTNILIRHGACSSCIWPALTCSCIVLITLSEHEWRSMCSYIWKYVGFSNSWGIHGKQVKVWTFWKTYLKWKPWWNQIFDEFHPLAWSRSFKSRAI